MKLYGYWRSSATWRVRIGLQHKGVDYTYVPVHLVRDGGEQFSDAHRARNPMAQVPVLELDDGTQLTQSLAILEYLDQVHPTPSLLPADPVQRARVRQLSEVVNAGIQPLQNLSVMRQITADGADGKAFGRRWIASGLAALEALATTTAGAFLVGDAVTLADCCLVPQLYNARRFGIDLAPFPTLTRVDAACEALPAFQAAHPDAQVDAQ